MRPTKSFWHTDRLMITLHMLEQEVTVLGCSHVLVLYSNKLRRKNATLQPPLAGSLRTNHSKYFGMYLTKERNKNTKLVTIDTVVASLENAKDKTPIDPELLKELYKLFRSEWAWQCFDY
eukprot:TRINITY_DN108_c0_g1_i15.p1 TRINITY_DN108_c0_g1~~TRINITY_DN108_c0_g1_i15.p1  ORF type:complete len:120 (+),score=13.93 TRINITY_DN108_c0_g1_i15:635-994(+)